jgi:hypothetical protein
MIKTKIGRAAGFGAAAIVAALGFATAVLAPPQPRLECSSVSALVFR